MVTDYTKPALPEPDYCGEEGYFDGYSSGKLVSYADACVAAALAHVRAEQAEATSYARNLAIALHAQHYSEVAQWRPLGDVLGLLTQIDNMVSSLMKPQPVSGAAATTQQSLQVEPVAWMGDGTFISNAVKRTGANFTRRYHTPLYTHPQPVSGAADPVGLPAGEQTGPVSAAPTLTDEEILDVARNDGWHVWHTDIRDEAVAFARAIEAAIRARAK